jgi:tRNA threonylcarbamoyladenosine biosynthesis protein TsaB
LTFPLTLSVDTATARGIVVLARGSAIIASSTYDAGSDHAEKLLDHVKIVLDRASLTLADVATFGVGIGPGSFTGVRVGVTTIKGFGLVFPRPVIPVSSLAPLVDAASIPPSGLVALATAGREDSFVGVFQSAADLLVPNAGDVEVVPHATLPAWCEARGLVTGVGADFARLLPLLADRTVDDGLPTPEALANLVSRSAPLPPSAVVDLEPAYARPPQITLSRAQRANI